jgi:DNA gyrase/topoisomerase IV subunit A
MESIMLTLSKLSAFLNENSESLFDGPSLPRQSSLTAADMDDITSMERDDLEKSYKTLKTVIADMEKKLIRERERAKAMPKAMSNIPTSLEVR